MSLDEQLWRTPDHARWFILPDAVSRVRGALAIESLAGEGASVDPAWLGRYEVDEAEAHAWAKQEFGIALAEIKRRIDARLGRMRNSLDAAKRTPVRPGSEMARDALPALLSLARALPRAILDGLSGDPARVSNAGNTLDGIEQRLSQAGVSVKGRVSRFPDRLAALRAEVAASPPPAGRGGERD